MAARKPDRGGLLTQPGASAGGLGKQLTRLNFWILDRPRIRTLERYRCASKSRRTATRAAKGASSNNDLLCPSFGFTEEHSSTPNDVLELNRASGSFVIAL